MQIEIPYSIIEKSIRLNHFLLEETGPTNDEVRRRFLAKSNTFNDIGEFVHREIQKQLNVAERKDGKR